MDLQIETSSPSINECVIHVTGEVDIMSAAELKSAIHQEIDNNKDKIDLNLDSVEYMDSTGLEVLITASKTLTEKGGTLTLVSPTPRVMRILELTGLVSHFSIVPAPDTVDENETVPAV